MMQTRKNEMIEFHEGWNGIQKILVILAHPDDPEFFCGGTLARWAKAGHEIVYYLLTRGDKGSNDPLTDPEKLAQLREKEQKSAAKVIGVKEVNFSNHPDGFLIPDVSLRKEIVRIIRKERPDILVSSDPLNYFPSGNNRLNHPDHRAAGLAVMDGYFPAAGNPLFFPELMAEGLLPHSVKEVWFSIPSEADTIIDITDTWPTKLKALHEHASQIGDPNEFDVRMMSRRTLDSTDDQPRFEERFRRIVF